jgi:hypothetical protein
MLPIVQAAAYLPFAAVFIFTITLYVVPPFGVGHISNFAIDAPITGLNWMLIVVGIFAAAIGATAFQNRPLAIMAVATILVAGHLTGRGALLPILQVVGMMAWCLITVSIFSHLILVDMQGRHMFWSRWGND